MKSITSNQFIHSSVGDIERVFSQLKLIKTEHGISLPNEALSASIIGHNFLAKKRTWHEFENGENLIENEFKKILNTKKEQSKIKRKWTHR